MAKTNVRKVLSARYGARNYRITQDGEIHVYGTIPNTNQVGWFLFGYIDDNYTKNRIDCIKDDLNLSRNMFR
jgi:hypothetical protein